MPTDFMIGRQLGNFKIERLLGRGGMAQVYYGHDVKLKRAVAIKILDARYQNNPAYARRFVREAQTIATWRHENILQIYYADEENGLYYFVMEYIDGLDLGQRMSDYARRKECFPYEDVINIGRAVANALDYAHEKGVVHRDVKPSNVMLTSDGRVVLADFGLALDVQQGTLGEVFGSAHYIAPEQARNSSGAVPQSDLYSLGVILYEMLTGAVPFDDPSPISVSLQHMTTPPPAPRTLNPKLTPDAEAILLKALSKSPKDRYPTGAALIDALEAALSHPTASFSSITMPEIPNVAPRETGKGKRWVIGGLLILLFGVLVGIWVIFGKDLIPTTGVSPLTESPLATPTATAPTTATREVAAPITSLTKFQVYIPLVQKSPKGRRFLLYYNQNGFYVYNLSGQDSYVASLSFERLDANDRPLERLEGARWARYFAVIRNGKCVSAEIRNSAPSRPEQCTSFSSQITFLRDDPLVIWREQEGSTHFRVLWNDEEVERCAIDEGECEVYLP